MPSLAKIIVDLNRQLEHNESMKTKLVALPTKYMGGMTPEAIAVVLLRKLPFSIGAGLKKGQAGFLGQSIINGMPKGSWRYATEEEIKAEFATWACKVPPAYEVREA